MFLNSSGLAHAMLEDFKTAYEELKSSLHILIATLGAAHVEVAVCLIILSTYILPYSIHARVVYSTCMFVCHPSFEYFISILIIIIIQ